jgi:hypothetical protein
MTWTKLGDEWPDASCEMTDAAFRTHIEALCWSNRRGLDLIIPKRDLKRFAETDDPDTAVKNLIATGWWQDCSDSWFVGVQFGDWQIEATVVKKRREDTALRVQRHRLHQAGDHSLCLVKNCNALRNALRDALPGTGRDGAVLDGTARDEREDQDQGGSDDDWPPVRSPGTCRRCGRPLPDGLVKLGKTEHVDGCP